MLCKTLRANREMLVYGPFSLNCFTRHLLILMQQVDFVCAPGLSLCLQHWALT